MDDYLESVAIDVRFTIPPADLPYVVELLEDFARLEGLDISYPPGDGLPTEHTLPIFAGVDDD